MHNLRKEISESYSILSAMKQIMKQLNNDNNIDNIFINDDDNDDDEDNMKQLIVIDLCSGKCLTTTLLHTLYPYGTYLAIDKLPKHMIPHCISNILVDHDNDNDSLENNNNNDDNSRQWYWSCNIMEQHFVTHLQNTIKQYINEKMKQQEEEELNFHFVNDNNDNDTPTRRRHRQRPIVILVGMHLCGNLSYRAIEILHTIQFIDAIILCPCCLPKKKKKKKQQQRHDNNNNNINLTKTTIKPDEVEEKILTTTSTIKNNNQPYEDWVKHLKCMITNNDNNNTNIHNDITYCHAYQDNHMNTDKNSIIIATRTK